MKTHLSILFYELFSSHGDSINVIYLSFYFIDTLKSHVINVSTIFLRKTNFVKSCEDKTEHENNGKFLFHFYITTYIFKH